MPLRRPSRPVEEPETASSAGFSFRWLSAVSDAIEAFDITGSFRSD